MTQKMTQQQPFESEGPFLSEHYTQGDKRLSEMLDAYNAEHPPLHTRMNRFEKLEYLQETTAFSHRFVLNELVGWMTDDDFNQFWEYFCQLNDVCESPEELQQRYGE